MKPILKLTVPQILPWARRAFVEENKRDPTPTELATSIISIQERGATFKAIEEFAVEHEAYRVAAAVVKERE